MDKLILKKTIESALAEDIGTGDITGNSVIPADAVGKYVFTAREEMVFCGVEVLAECFPVAEIFVNDGEKIPAGKVIAEVIGNVRDILAKERTALNLIQHLSGIATITAKYVEAVAHTRAEILDTRKTLPNLRELQKYAVVCGGGVNHRMGLYDMVLIKDNHIAAAGSIAVALQKAKNFVMPASELASGSPLNAGMTRIKIEVECDTLEQVREALEAGADIIMADNMSLENLREAVKIVGGRVPIEASGNVNLQTVKAIAETGVDFISTSRITMSAPAVDIGLDIA